MIIRKRSLIVIGLELYALALAAYQSVIGVRTDEAKYLLDIPYPHPPLARFILSLIDGWACQELFWRVVFATLVVQAVWLVVDLLKDRKPLTQIAGAACWLLSAAVVLQAGTVMMAVLTALQALVLVWLLLRDRPVQPYLLALYWLACLFTAYQAILFAPPVFFLFRKIRVRFIGACVLCGAPVALLALYTFANPLVPASMLNHAGKDAAETLLQHLSGTAHLWMIGGSIILSIAGTLGLLIRPKLGLIGSFVLVAAYVFLARYDYYAILFTPLLIGGLILLLRRFSFSVIPLILLMPIGLACSLPLASPLNKSTVPQVIQAIGTVSGTGDVLIVGGFGHEWQYASSTPVRPFHPWLLAKARAVVCLAACPDMKEQEGWWKRIDGLPVEVWAH